MFEIKVCQGQNEKTFLAQKGTNLLSLLLQNDILLESPCGGMGICGKCKVKIKEDTLQNNACYKLACTIVIDKDMTIEIPEDKDIYTQIMVSGELDVSLNPSIEKRIVELNVPDIQDQTSDVTRIETAMMMPNSIPVDIMQYIPDVLRDSDFKIAVITYENEILSVEAYNTKVNQYGIAVDIGTTTIVGYLMDLYTGEQLGAYSFLNPQAIYGADIITRIDYTLESPQGLSRMANLLKEEINNMIYYFCQKYEIVSQDIYEIDVVGNTVMMHLFLELPVKNIAVSPFIPVVCRKIELSAKDVDIDICTHGKIVILPMVSGYIGADTVAAILASGMHKTEKIGLLIDIGTNGEIVLGNKDNIIACSTAAGPAFEGARIECGLGGVQGAINRVFVDEEIKYTTIGELPAKGICGSGIVDAVAQMLNIGLLDFSGRMLSPEEAIKKFPTNIGNKIVLQNGQPAFFLELNAKNDSQYIYISQKDIREVQLAKGAIRAGIEVLMKVKGVSYDDISNVYLAGGFGNYIDYRHAMDIGLIPKEFSEKIIGIGNGAGVGAKMALLSKDAKKEANEIKEKTKYIELSAIQDFQTYFINSLEFR